MSLANIFLKIFLSILIFAVLGTATATAPKIVVTIKPIYLLSKAILNGVVNPTLLINTIDSPHEYRLKPSDRISLDSADLIIWVGPELESQLTKYLQQHKSMVLSILKAPNLHKLAIRNSENCQNNHDEHHHHHHHHHGHWDPHVWLDPLNAIKISEYIADRLKKIDSKNASLYQQNLNAVVKNIKDIHRNLTKKTLSLQKKPFLVFHDAYQYFENRYSLSFRGAITYNLSIPLSLQRMHNIESLIKNQNICCIFSEPQVNSAVVKDLAERFHINYNIIDPLGSHLANDATYEDFINDITASFESCFN